MKLGKLLVSSVSVCASTKKFLIFLRVARGQWKIERFRNATARGLQGDVGAKGERRERKVKSEKKNNRKERKGVVEYRNEKVKERRRKGGKKRTSHW